MVEFPKSIRPSFVAAGWYPKRRVQVSSTVPADHPAAEILAEFGDLTVMPPRGKGEQCAPEDITFQELDPDASILHSWNDLLNTRLFGIAESCSGHGELYIAADGRCFGLSCVHDAFYIVGETFPEAAERLLLGRRSRPLLRPDQASTTLYGNLFTADCPGLYRYR